jgi:hypothetical protein
MKGGRVVESEKKKKLEVVDVVEKEEYRRGSEGRKRRGM